MIAPRRLATVPLATAISVCVLVVGPLLLVASALAAITARSTRPARTVGLVMAYAVIELRTLVKLALGDVDGDRLVKDFLMAAYVAARKLLDVEVVLDPSSASPESIPCDKPVIVLSRHCGPGDSVLVAWLLTFTYRLQVRVVLKAVLRYEPVLDFAGQRGCLYFLDRGDHARRTNPRSGRVTGRRPGAADLSRRSELHLAPVARRDRRTSQDWPDPRGRTRITTLLYVATAGWRCRRCGERGARRQCPGAHSQRLPSRRAGTALVAVAGSPETARPHDSRAG